MREKKLSNWSNEELVRLLYREFLNREPDADGMSHFTQELTEGKDLRDIIQKIVTSDEYLNKVQTLSSGLSNEDLVRLLYTSLLNREPDLDGLQHFSAAISNGIDIREITSSITASDEYKRKTKALSPDILGLAEKLARPLNIVDVGAQKLASEDHIYAPLTRGTLQWKCIGFEPQEERLQERQAAEGSPNLIMMNAFIGDGSDAVFHLVNKDGSSSLLELNESFNSSFDDISEMHVVSREAVKTTTLDDALRGETYVDFLKLDIQGFEYKALKAAPEILKRTNVVHCEVLFSPQYKGASYFRDIDAFLSEKGFEFIDFTHLNRYHYVGVPLQTEMPERLIWADAVFFKKNPRTHDDRLAQAIIASMVYRKHGLAQSILGTELAYDSNGDI